MTLRRVLGPVDAAWLVAGNMIGAGIFATPGLVVGGLPGAAWALGAWILGGVLALCGAAVYAELGARLPRSGGDYQYLGAAFGPAWAFLTGWAAFVLTFSAAAAAMATAAVQHLQRVLVPEGPASTRMASVVGALVVLALTAANTAGARLAGWVTAALTAVPIAGLIALYGAGLVSGGGGVAWPEHPFATPREAWPVAFGAAMIPVFFTYSGWNAAAYVAGEIRDPGRNLPRALLAGTGLVAALYLAVNVVLICAVPAEVLAGSTTAGAEAARRLLGPGAARALSLLIAVAILGSANVTLMAGARVYYAMACDRLAPAALARVNRAGVPGVALWTGGLWSAVLAATGTFSRLVSGATLAILLLSSVTVAALYVLRRRDPGGSPYLCPGYPFTPALYVIASLGVVVAAAAAEPRSSLAGTLLVLAGLPVYAFTRRRGARAGPRADL